MTAEESQKLASKLEALIKTRNKIEELTINADRTHCTVRAKKAATLLDVAVDFARCGIRQEGEVCPPNPYGVYWSATFRLIK